MPMPPEAENFVERAQRALVEVAVLEELRRESLDRDLLVDRILDIGGFDDKVDEAFVDACIDRLREGGHLDDRAAGHLEITHDGRQDIEKIEAALCGVTAAEVPGAVIPEANRTPPGGGVGTAP